VLAVRQGGLYGAPNSGYAAAPMQTKVVFDFGGVLVKIEPSLATACRAAGLPERVRLDAPELRRQWEELDRLHQVGRIGTDEFFERIGVALGGAYAREELERVHRGLLADPYPGVAELVRELHARGVATGILSNTNPSHWRALREEYPAFRALFAGDPRYVQPSHLLGARKPEPVVYRAYLEVTELDDFAENVQGAREQGWRAFQIDATRDPVAEIRDILARLG
jgi:FMN phosphatase YigB (HAD superfamily)